MDIIFKLVLPCLVLAGGFLGAYLQFKKNDRKAILWLGLVMATGIAITIYSFVDQATVASTNEAERIANKASIDKLLQDNDRLLTENKKLTESVKLANYITSVTTQQLLSDSGNQWNSVFGKTFRIRDIVSHLDTKWNSYSIPLDTPIGGVLKVTYNFQNVDRKNQEILNRSLWVQVFPMYSMRNMNESGTHLLGWVRQPITKLVFNFEDPNFINLDTDGFVSVEIFQKGSAEVRNLLKRKVLEEYPGVEGVAYLSEIINQYF